MKCEGEILLSSRWWAWHWILDSDSVLFMLNTKPIKGNTAFHIWFSSGVQAYSSLLHTPSELVPKGFAANTPKIYPLLCFCSCCWLLQRLANTLILEPKVVPLRDLTPALCKWALLVWSDEWRFLTTGTRPSGSNKGLLERDHVPSEGNMACSLASVKWYSLAWGHQPCCYQGSKHLAISTEKSRPWGSTAVLCHVVLAPSGALQNTQPWELLSGP